jgi:membrane protein involved in colicin uptake
MEQVILVKMERTEPQHAGGPTTADVHPSEVAAFLEANWQLAAEPVRQIEIVRNGTVTMIDEPDFNAETDMTVADYKAKVLAEAEAEQKAKADAAAKAKADAEAARKAEQKAKADAEAKAKADAKTASDKAKSDAKQKADAEAAAGQTPPQN